MDLLKRNLAPILPEAWNQIDEEARRVLSLHLAGRKLVDFDGPHGWKYAAVNTGRMSLLEKQPVQEVHVGIRKVQPLIELRTPFEIDIMELDYIARGIAAPDLDPVLAAAERIARAEDNAIFNGYKDAGISGIIESSPHKPLTLSKDAAGYPALIVQAKETLREEGINGPYALALGPKAYNELAQAADDGYPISKRVDTLIEGPLVWAPVLEGVLLMSIRGGDFVLTVGQDYSIGYASRDKQSVELYLTESFTFRVLEPAAALYLRHSERKP